jgi:hypothetical protein
VGCARVYKYIYALVVSRNMDKMDHARKKGRTILCPGTIGKLGSASRVHALSLDRKDMEHSSSCWDKYMTPLTRAMDPVMDSLPYLVFLCGNSTTVWLTVVCPGHTPH